MQNFKNLSKFFNEKLSSDGQSCLVTGVSQKKWSYIFGKNLALSNKTEQRIFVLPNRHDAEKFFESLKNNSTENALLFLGHDGSPYHGVIHSEREELLRFSTLGKIPKANKVDLVTDVTSLTLKVPGPDFFKSNSFEITKEDIISPYDLANKLVSIGYTSSTTVEEPGTFSRRGEIVDIYPIGSGPIRLNYFDDLIEEIFSIDLDTQKTNKEVSFESVQLLPAPQIVRNDEFVKTLRKNIPQPGPKDRELFLLRKEIFEQLSDQTLFQNYSCFIPLFIPNTCSVLDYFDLKSSTIVNIDYEKAEHEYETFVDQIKESHKYALESHGNETLLGDVSNLFDFDFSKKIELFKTINTAEHLIGVDFSHDYFELKLESLKVYLANKGFHSLKNTAEKLNAINKISADISMIELIYQNSATRKQIENLCENYPSLKQKLKFQEGTIDSGFYYLNENILLLSESDFFVQKTKTNKKVTKKAIDLFAEQMRTLQVGDFVVHNDHGVAEYLGLQTMKLGGTESDFITLKFDGGDKVYVPVYKIGLIQKYADKDASIKLANLNSNKFKALKNKAKKSAKKLAFDLLKLQAERESQAAYAFNPPDDLYNDFELKFPFVETTDQLSAVNDVIEDMQKSKPMDRLVCGDVGFGKTEVAMRAAFKAVEDKKQVAILVPTTVLALQHFYSFKKRFKDFPVEIDYISRFKTGAQIKETLERLEQGKLDIIIGTHRLLSKDVVYHDIGLVVVDEEQRFGVGHKEKLKLLKASCDFLTLTATPIPRTLQMAFLGIRDLSLIQSPPPKRLSIKTYIIKQDDATLRDAINKELKRGGQVFYVHNRVNDIEEVAAYIKELVPSAKVVIGHGQLPEKELEKRMNDFYQGNFNVLLSTTIIESGIDIPSANTMIIDRADMYGLAQLHQLRGRIGRSDKKAYAYFVIPKTKKLTDIASKRLQALQTYADMGSGFSIASSDLEIRGAGDLLGAEQSGHMEAVGLETYMELLNEAVAELKGVSRALNDDVEVQSPISSYIPSDFMTDPQERLRTYKRLSNAKNGDLLQEIYEEIQDRYGLIPQSFENLFILLRSRLNFQKVGINRVKCTGKMIEMQFNKEYLEENSKLRESVIAFFMNNTNIFKLSQDFKVSRNFKKPITMETILEVSTRVADNIVSG